MFFMPEYYPLQILLSGAFPENFLSAVLGRIVTGRPRRRAWAARSTSQTRAKAIWFRLAAWLDSIHPSSSSAASSSRAASSRAWVLLSPRPL
jgi:hypothetical protein